MASVRAEMDTTISCTNLWITIVYYYDYTLNYNPTLSSEKLLESIAYPEHYLKQLFNYYYDYNVIYYKTTNQL